MDSPVVLFKTWPLKQGSPYNPCHGVYQMKNGDLLVIGCISKSEEADSFFEKMAKLPSPMVADLNPIVAGLQELGAPPVTVGQRFRRRVQKPNEPEAANDTEAKEDDQCSRPTSENPSS